MNKQHLVDAIATKTDISKKQASAVLETLLGTIKLAVAKGDTVRLIGFGSCSSGKRAARTRRNPSTGAAMEIAAAKTVKFSAGKAFEDAVNGTQGK